MEEQQLHKIRDRLYKDLPFYAENLLKIRPKKGGLIPFVLNRPQRYVHEQLEKQLKETGKVRALIPKARQEGISTYVGARFYHKTTHSFGIKAYILSHQKDTTEELFNMVDTYHSSIPPMFQAKASTDNTKELVFADLEKSGYRVGTAGGEGTMGRGMTIQLLHGSEVAKWKNEAEIMSGIMEAVPDCDGSEIILESTGDGIDNMFHRMCMDAVEGKNEYQVIFIPWFWMEEYYMDTREDFSLSTDEQKYMKLYELNEGQMAWRRNKIAKLGESKFSQEYPAIISECFQIASTESLIGSDDVMAARRTNIQEKDRHSAKVLGVDPARHGGDRTAMIWRVGRTLVKKEVFTNDDLMGVVGKVVMAIREDDLDKVFLDVGGLGWGIYDRLREILGKDSGIIIGVNAGEKALDKEKYFNKRAEMWGEMNDWIKSAPCDLLDDDELMMDLTCPGYTWDSNGRLKLESKDDIRKKGRKSPDLGDALALTFSFPVNKVTRSQFYGTTDSNKGNMYV